MSQYTFLEEFVEDEYGCKGLVLPNHDNYYSKEAIEEQIKEDLESIERTKRKLFGMCSGNIKDIFLTKDAEGGEIEPLHALEMEFDDIFGSDAGSLPYLYWHIAMLEIFRDNWDNVKNE